MIFPEYYSRFFTRNRLSKSFLRIVFWPVQKNNAQRAMATRRFGMARRFSGYLGKCFVQAHALFKHCLIQAYPPFAGISSTALCRHIHEKFYADTRTRSRHAKLDPKVDPDLVVPSTTVAAEKQVSSSSATVAAASYSFKTSFTEELIKLLSA